MLSAKSGSGLQSKILFIGILVVIGLLIEARFSFRAAVGFKVVWTIASVTWAIAAGFLIRFVGDAARYLHVAPPNIQSRHRIRQAGVKLLRSLHNSTDYDRIVVVGHSLGSVIGYDILTHLWSRYNDSHVPAKTNEEQANCGSRSQSVAALTALEEIARANESPLRPNEYQAAQPNLLQELQKNGNHWLISDFVTVGSPLAHADFLLARTKDEFDRKKREREYPTSPPAFEIVDGDRRFSFKKDDIWIPHHAAVFAVTRWTNLYFPAHWTFWGDVIGGPVSPHFGAGVLDIPIQSEVRSRFFTHSLYWNRDANCSDLHVEPLRDAVRLA